MDNKKIYYELTQTVNRLHNFCIANNIAVFAAFKVQNYDNYIIYNNGAENQQETQDLVDILRYTFETKDLVQKALAHYNEWPPSLVKLFIDPNTH